jgi:hypothetical protein
MKSGREVLHWDSPMPRSVHRRHEDPDTSDNYGHIRRAAAEVVGRDGIRATDTNLQAFWSTRQKKYVKCGAHWKSPGPNGYTRIKRKFVRGTRKLTKKELSKTTWTWEQVRRWRRPNGELPRTYDELLAYAVRCGVVVIGEEKHPVFKDVATSRETLESCKHHDSPAWFMVLITLSPRSKIAATRKAGAQIALIFGDNPKTKPSTWSNWSTYPNRIWPYRAGWLPTK